jgi:hypothetical protein
VQCPQCDNVNREGARFCLGCGASLLALSPVWPKCWDARPREVQEAFQFLLPPMHKAGKFELASVVEVEGRWHYTFWDGH